MVPGAAGSAVPRLVPALRGASRSSTSAEPHLRPDVQLERSARLHRDHPSVENEVRCTEPQEVGAQLRLAPRWLTSADFRLAFTSGVSANNDLFRARAARPLPTRVRESRMSTPEGMLLLAAGTAFASRERSVAQPRTLRGLENYPGRGLTWRCSCQSSPAASSASWTRCHAAPPDSSSRMRTCPRSSGICLPRPRCLATAASSSSARLPGRITWTTIAVSGTRADRSRGPPTHPARATGFPAATRPGTSPAAGVGRDGWAAAERSARPLRVVVVHAAHRTRSSWRGPTISSQSNLVCLARRVWREFEADSGKR